jgi:hypothetical protein
VRAAGRTNQIGAHQSAGLLNNNLAGRQSGLRRLIFYFLRRASTQAETSQAVRGMQAAKFGHDFGFATEFNLRC